MNATEEQPNLTSKGVIFAEWATCVADDDLTFVSVRNWGSNWVEYPTLGYRLSLIDAPARHDYDLEAMFLSKEKKAVVRFEFQGVSAFRVLDEHGLEELWNASAQSSRPAHTTFKVKGHGWQAESGLVWLMGSGPEHFSYVVATSAQCLEVICLKEPNIKITPASIQTLN